MVYFTNNYGFGLWLSFLQLFGSKLRDFVGWSFSSYSLFELSRLAKTLEQLF